MRCLGNLYVIWGVLLPLMTYPWVRGYVPQLGLLGSLPAMYIYVLETEVSYASVVLLGLFIVGLGLTVIAAADWIFRERLMRALERVVAGQAGLGSQGGTPQK
ncbi:MAG TPA: hypothetical protein VD978_18660 [Azospirillum sp.]|nr:hypothetical protein [Azospirillum sp.]